MSETTKTVVVKVVSSADTKGPDAMGASLKEMESRLQRLDREYAELNAEMAKMDLNPQATGWQGVGAASQGAAVGIVSAGGASRNSGMAVLELSRALEDAQYGIRGVLNNIPGLITMLGGGMGLAGIVSIAAVAVTQLWEKFGGAADAEADLEKLNEAAEKLEGRLSSLAAIVREDFGQALTEQKGKLAELMSEWETASKNLKQSYGEMDKGVARQLEQDLAKLEMEKEQALAGATPEEAGQIEEDFKRRAENLQGLAKQESAGVKVDAARQQEEVARDGIKQAEAAQQQAADQVRAAQEEKKAAEKRLYDAGVLSDQDRAEKDFATAKGRFQVAQGKGDEEGMQKFLKEMETLGPRAEAAREEKARGVTSYGEAAKDESLTPRQKEVLSTEGTTIENAKASEQAARDNFKASTDNKAKAEEAFGEAKMNTRSAIEEMGTVDTQEAARVMKQTRESAPVSSAALEQSANSVGQSGERMSGAAEQMVAKVDATMSKVASTLESLMQRMATIEANASRLQASAQSQKAAGVYG
jgi:hypothetical protein